MTSDLQSLVEEVVALTGNAPPALLNSDSPVLQVSERQQIYLVGLIGGKEVGKSSLVNALVGEPISEQADSGPGTELAIAYAHHAATAELQPLLESIVPGRYRIVPHNVKTLEHQVLVDLPDIDSHWAEHVALTRRMLRHMLFPLWLQSVEKYADRQPQQLLQQVAAGNDPANFLFCLNKCDQLSADHAARLSTDYADRLQQTLSLTAAPRVFLVSATQPSSLDLPNLRATLASQKPAGVVQQSQQLALKRQDHSLLHWLDTQQLGSRAAQSARLLHEAEELLAARIGVPLLEQTLPRVIGDAGYRLSIIEPVVNARVGRWPLVNVLNTALLPLTTLVRRNIGDGKAEASVRAPSVQAAFALLHRSHPNIASLYRSRKLWDDLPAASAELDLRERLTMTIERQRQEAMTRFAGGSVLFGPVRWLITIGAAIWFPIAQPILQTVLASGWTGKSQEVAFLTVQLLGAAYLLKTISFLVIYFLVLWALLRWDTHRRVTRFIQRLSIPEADVQFSLPAQALAWIDELLQPLQQDVEQASELAKRIEQARSAV